MTIRRKRFFGTVAICQPKTTESLTSGERPNLTGWDFRTATHPLDGNKIALADRGMTLHGEFDPTNSHINYNASLFLTAARLSNSKEVSAGIGIWIQGTISDIRHSILDNQNVTGFVHCFETAPATRDTTQMRAAWKFADGTTKSDVAVFRGVPRLAHISETVIFLEQEMTALWASGEYDPVREESALSARTAALAAGDKMAIAIPWIHRDHELIAEVDLSKLAHAVAKVKALVAPPPSE